MDFQTWIKQINAILTRNMGFTIDDLPDCCYADWHEEGLTPREAARAAIRAAKGEE